RRRLAVIHANFHLVSPQMTKDIEHEFTIKRDHARIAIESNRQLSFLFSYLCRWCGNLQLVLLKIKEDLVVILFRKQVHALYRQDLVARPQPGRSPSAAWQSLAIRRKIAVNQPGIQFDRTNLEEHLILTNGNSY